MTARSTVLVAVRRLEPNFGECLEICGAQGLQTTNTIVPPFEVSEPIINSERGMKKVRLWFYFL
jgi:hypothetical protein